MQLSFTPTDYQYNKQVKEDFTDPLLRMKTISPLLPILMMAAICKSEPQVG